MKKALLSLFFFVSCYAVSQTSFSALNYLYNIQGKQTLSGQEGRQYWEPMHTAAGLYPALWGEDFSFYPWGNTKSMSEWRTLITTEAKARWAEGAFISLMFHACPPTQAEPCNWDGGIISSLTDEQWNDLITDGGSLNTNWKARLDVIYPYLKELQDDSVQVFFRPLHEMNQGQFWWAGRKGSNGTAKLFQITHDYLVKTKGLTNLIWVWDLQDYNTLANDLNDYDPGNEYWDILALDVYWSDGTGYTDTKYNLIKNKANGKPIAIGECDVLPSSSLLSSQPNWTFFMGWCELTQKKNSDATIKAVYEANNVKTLDANAHKEVSPYKVSISGTKFTVNGKDFYINGVNAPWQYQTDCNINFMRKNYSHDYWDAELKKYKDANANVVRVWLHGSGDYSPSLNESGYVTAYADDDQFWKDMDDLVSIAEKYKIYLMPTFWSFDMAKEGQSSKYTQYRQILLDDNKAGSYLNNFLIPFVKRYADTPWIMGYDLCNEPEHIWRDNNCGNLNEWWVTRFFARCAAVVHQNCDKPVTIGSMWAIYNSDVLGNGDGDTRAGFNRYKDSQLKTYADNNNYAYLDFYSPHWYQWQGNNGPFNRTVTQWIGEDNKPVITGETFGGDIEGVVSMADFYKNSYTNGFDGVVGWKNACQNDGYGKWDGVKKGLAAFYEQHPELVFPYTDIDEENIAYNKPVFVNSEEDDNGTIRKKEYLVDENLGTRWSSDWADTDQSIYIDLQGNYNISKVILYWEAAYATQFQIQVSNDANTWTTVYENYSATGGTNEISLNTSGRYVKVYAFQKATQYGYSLYEFKVFGTPNFPTDIQKASVDKITLYPNPATDILNIYGCEIDNVKIFNAFGAEILQANETSIDICNLANGYYVASITDRNGNVTSKGFIKK